MTTEDDDGTRRSLNSTVYLLQSIQQGGLDGGHVVRVERNAGTADLLGKHSLLFQLQHKFTNRFLIKCTHTHIKLRHIKVGNNLLLLLIQL